MQAVIPPMECRFFFYSVEHHAIMQALSYRTGARLPLGSGAGEKPSTTPHIKNYQTPFFALWMIGNQGKIFLQNALKLIPVG
jgi:hypothetical protein